MSNLILPKIPIANDELSELLSEQREVKLLFHNLNRPRVSHRSGTYHARQRESFIKAAAHLKECLDTLKKITTDEVAFRESLKVSE